ncbi:hypothetical protein V1525DRAFT_397274 [Lipomyces kononenkoae]|uniref:Uncharacterized protein n=1 Tax=Lipomyces kononenkoae TaxID=34357 RepID=A0ACC3T6U0_LIPKO
MPPVSRPAQSVGKRRLSRKTRVVSCTECHRRKQKCDRESPCNQCILRKAEDLCHYANENRTKQLTNYPSRSSVTVPPLPQPTSRNPVPMLHFQSTASRLQPYRSSDRVPPFDTAAVIATLTPVPSEWPSQSTDGEFQMLALAQHHADLSSQSYSLAGGYASTSSDSVDDNAGRATVAIVESLSYLQLPHQNLAQNIGGHSGIYELPENLVIVDTTAVSDRVASAFPKEQSPVENVYYPQCHNDHMRPF